MMFDLRPYFLLLWKKRWFLFANMVIVLLAAAAYVFFVVKKEYLSQATFLPPSGPSNAIMSLSANPLLGLLGSDESGDNIEAVFDSKILKRKLINRFGLYENYRLEKNPNKFENAVRRMQRQVVLASTMKGKGIGMSKTIAYSVKCYHTSPDTALLMTEFLFACLDSTMIDISINKARRNREFIESQFRASQEKLDSLQAEFKEFQVTHKAFDITEQTKLTLKVYSEVKSAAIMNDLRLNILQREFKGNSPEVAEALNAKRVYERKLAEFEKKEEHDVLPSLNLSSELMPLYANLYRALEVQNQVHLLLIRELEQARLQEARDVSPLVLIDPPYTAEYKARPKRILMIALITGLYMSALMFILVAIGIFKEHFLGYLKTLKSG